MAPRLGDTLKLAGTQRLPLDEGESLIGSGKTETDSAVVRWAVTDHDGHVTVRLGIGSGCYGTRDDEAGPWVAGPDNAAAEEARRAPLRAERNRIEDTEPSSDPATAAADAARFDELAEMDLGEVYASGYTARITLADLDKLTADAAPAVAAARAHGEALAAYYDEQDRLEADLDALRGIVVDENNRPRKWTPEEEAAWDAAEAALAVHKATPEPAPPYELAEGYYFGQGVIRGAWGDVHWQVEFDETAHLDLGVVPHGHPSVADLSDLSGEDSSARLSLGLTLAGYDDPDEAGKLIKQLGRVSAAGHAAQAAGTTGPAYAGRRRAPAELGQSWGNVVEAWTEALSQPFPEDGAVEEIDAYFRAFGEVCQQIGAALCDRAGELFGEVPLVGRLLDHMDQAGEGWCAIAAGAGDVHATWAAEFAEALRRQREPRPGEGMLNVN